MTAPVLKTRRLVLRQLTVDDGVELFKTLSDEQVMQYWSSGPHRTVDETTTYLQWNADTGMGHKCWAITREGGAAMGWVILIPHRPANFELGYILGREHWRQGFVTEAASAALDYAFGELAARRVMADADPDNLASIRTIERLGFRQEGHLREEWETHIGIRDSLIFGILRNEWKSRRV